MKKSDSWFVNELLGSWTRTRERDPGEERPRRPTAEKLAEAFKKNGVRPVARKWGASIQNGRYSTLSGEGCAITAYMHGRESSHNDSYRKMGSSFEGQLRADFEALTGIRSQDFIHGFDGGSYIPSADYELGREVRRLVEPEEHAPTFLDAEFYSNEPDKATGDQLKALVVLVDAMDPAPAAEPVETEKSWAADEEALIQTVGVATEEP